MDDLKQLFKNRSSLTNLVIVFLLLVGLPIGLGLVRQQQVLRSRADDAPIVFIAGDCVKDRDNGSQYAICETIDLELSSPLGPGADDGSGNATASATPISGLNFSPIKWAKSLVKNAYAADCNDDSGCPTGESCNENTRTCEASQGSGGTHKNIGKACNKDSACKDSALVCVNKRCALGASPTPTAQPTNTPAPTPTTNPNATPTPDSGATPTPGGATPTPASGATPTPDPGDNDVITTNYKIAESPRDLQTAPWLPYPINPLFTSYTLKNTDPGTKTLYVQFKDSEGTLSDIETEEIELVGPPPVISNINCSRSLTGTGLTIKIAGSQFGPTKGNVDLTDDQGNTGSLGITGWTDEEISGNVTVGAGDAEGNTINFTVTRPDQTSTSGVCTVGGLSDLALGAKLFCRTLSDTDTDGVEVVIAENKPGGKVVKLQNLTIDKKGILQGITNQFEIGQEYIVSVKAPHSLRRVSNPFTAEDGTIQLVFRQNGLDDGNQNVLPIGDISPLGNEDGKIDNRDKFELIREFGLSSEGSAPRAADFNQDTIVNSIDWACMRYDFPTPGNAAVDEPEPKPQAQ